MLVVSSAAAFLESHTMVDVRLPGKALLTDTNRQDAKYMVVRNHWLIFMVGCCCLPSFMLKAKCNHSMSISNILIHDMTCSHHSWRWCRQPAVPADQTARQACGSHRRCLPAD